MSTPNMLLTLPTVGVTAGPAYATQVNAALTVVDSHDHATGSGVQITPAGLNINADLSINSQNVTDIRTARFTAQPAALTGASPDLSVIYVVNDDLYFNDGIGNQIAITMSGAVAGAPGNITNLVAPASVTYTSGGSPNYKFLSTATVSANLDAASLIMRNPGVTATYALTLQAPTLSSNFSITLPTPPVAPSFLQIDSSGIITNTIPTALGITAANLAADSVTTTKIINDAVTTAKILDANVTAAKLSFVPAIAPTVFTYSSTITGSTVAPTGATTCQVIAWGGGGGGGAGAGVAFGGGGGGASGAYIMETMTVVAGETINVVCGQGGAGGLSGLAGGVGSDTQIDAATSGWILKAPGGNGGAAGVGTTGGAGGDTLAGAGYTYGIGGNGGSGGPGVTGGAGRRSSHASAAAGQAGNGFGNGGGAGASGRLAATTAPAGNNGDSGAANSAAGGGGGPGSSGGPGGAGGAGGSGYILLIFNTTT